MRLSLRARLLATTGIAVTAALGALVWLSGRITEQRFETFLLEQRRAAGARQPALPVAEFAAFYREHGSWDGIGTWLAARARSTGESVLLLDSADQLLAASRPAITAVKATARAGGGLELHLREGDARGESSLLLAFDRDPERAVRDDDARIVGWAYPLPPPPSEVPATLFLRSVRRSLFAAMAALALLVLGLAAWSIHRTLAPIRALTAATRRVARGELTAQVEARADDEVGELARAFNAMAEELGRQRELRRRQTSDVAHELRTPLTSLSCQVEALEAGLVAPDAAALRSLSDDIASLRLLIDDLQELALAEAGELRLEPRPLDLASEATSVLSAYGLRTAAGPRLSAELAGLPPVLADPERLRQVLRNLLDNALAATAPTGAITLTGRAEGGEVELAVTDTGSGIEPEHLPHVFERLYRADPSRSRESGGAGLGLAITKQLVEAQGGRVGVESEPGRGSRFWVRLPRSAR